VSMRVQTPSHAAFYLVADSRYFVGVVALLNSLRLAGHRETVYVADHGLTRSQRDVLAGEAEVVRVPAHLSPNLSKWSVPSDHPADLMVLVDADVVVLRSLAPLLERARRRNIVAFADPMQRFRPEWRQLLGLGPLQEHRYVNAGALLLPRALAERLLPLVREGQSRVDLARSCHNTRARSVEYPFYYADQDVWNAVFAAEVRSEELDVEEARLAPHPPFAGLEPARDDSSYAYSDCVEPYLLHHTGPKPWLHPTPWNEYARLLPRLLTAEGLPLRLPASSVPARFRHGSRGRFERRRVVVTAKLAANRGRLGLRQAVEGFLQRARSNARVIKD
jgi:hypothetical protein